MLWTDKSKFEVFGSQRRTFVRRGKNKDAGGVLDASCQAWWGQCDGGGCFGGGKVGDLYMVKGILKKEDHSILQILIFSFY